MGDGSVFRVWGLDAAPITSPAITGCETPLPAECMCTATAPDGTLRIIDIRYNGPLRILGPGGGYVWSVLSEHTVERTVDRQATVSYPASCVAMQ